MALETWSVSHAQWQILSLLPKPQKTPNTLDKAQCS